MRRGFLVKAAAKNKGLSDKRDVQERPPSKPKDTLTVQEVRRRLHIPTSREDLPSEFRLPYGNLTEQEKALPEDYEKNDAISAASAIMCKTMPHINDGDGSTQWIISDDHAERKVLNTPGYPARKPKPRRPDLYEVRTTENMGQGVFAKHNIKRGEIIFSERPLLVAPAWMTKAGRNERYTLKQCHQIMMFENEKVLEVGFRRLTEDDKARFMALYNGHTNDGTGPLMGVMRTNAFGAQDLSEDGNKVFQYSALCHLGSRLNHSCRPNVIFFFKISSFSYQFVASQDIKAGEELYCAYSGLERSMAERQIYLAPYGFSCNCLACANATPATDELRKTYQGQVTKLEGMRSQPELMADVVESAKVLEAKMVAEGLNVTFDFITLLLVIALTCDTLGRRTEWWKYQQRIREYSRVHIHKNPSLQLFLE